MNRRLLSDMKGDVWNEEEIDRRSSQLAMYVNEIWPHAEVLAKELNLESVPAADSPVAPSIGLTPRQKNAQRYARFWSHYAQRFPGDGVKARYRLSNQWISRGNGNPVISIKFANGQVGISFTRWEQAEGGKKAWIKERRAIIDQLVGVGKQPHEYQSFDTNNSDNWDLICNWLHERLSRFLQILDAEQ